MKLRRLRSFLEERAAVGARRLGARCGSRHATHSQHAPRCDVTRGPSALRAPQAPLRRAQGRREKEAESCLDQTRWAVASRPGPRARLGALRARRRAEGLVCAVMKVWCVCVWSGVERRAAREKVGANKWQLRPCVRFKAARGGLARGAARKEAAWALHWSGKGRGRGRFKATIAVLGLRGGCLDVQQLFCPPRWRLLRASLRLVQPDACGMSFELWWGARLAAAGRAAARSPCDPSPWRLICLFRRLRLTCGGTPLSPRSRACAATVWRATCIPFNEPCAVKVRSLRGLGRPSGQH